MKYPKLSNFLAALLILAAAVYAFSIYGWLIALFVFVALLTPKPSAVLRDDAYPVEFSLPQLLDQALEAFAQALLPLSAFSWGVTNGKLLSNLK
ncbi:MAG TPA: hypothetical protein VGM62_09590, partial [Chthoniobacterales bacterium]